MAKQYNLIARENSFSKEKMYAIEGNILDTSTPQQLDSDEYKKFDFAIMSLALHHVDDAEGMIRSLAERLDDGGVLVIVDWVAPSEAGRDVAALKDSAAGHTVSHSGFKEADLRRMFEKAGLGNWGWKWFEELSDVPSGIEGVQQGFLARGTKGKGK